jgi:Chromosome segregation ATPases
VRAKPKGPWFQRFLISFFTVVLAVLVFWVLGFLMEDIESIEGPRYRDIEEQYVDRGLVEKSKQLAEEIAGTDREIDAKREEMRIVSDSSLNLQGTINQLIELQKLTIQKSLSLPEAHSSNLSESLAGFLESQKLYQAHSAELSRLAERKRALESERLKLEKTIEEQRKPARKEYERLDEKHNLRLAAFQLGILLPLLAAGVWLAAKKRGSVYFPLFLAFGGAVLVKSALVIHRYFPTRYFKYVIVLGLLAAVLRILVSVIRIVAFPGAQWLTKQYREAYERFLCPVCEYPIRTGPRKYMFWTRRTVNKVPLSNAGEEEKPYTCPACGTALFEECEACGRMRHALLPFCLHCGAEKTIAGDAEKDQSR